MGLELCEPPKMRSANNINSEKSHEITCFHEFSDQTDASILLSATLAQTKFYENARHTRINTKQEHAAK